MCVLKLMRDVSGDQEESDGSDISGYHSDSDSAIMTSGNSPYVSKSARYNFLYRSGQCARQHDSVLCICIKLFSRTALNGV
ncbi:hypothetical protein FJT64_013797 [Amphibalanus amphitrite]|uniref:Uncharacterized protein n=1 Tax=Amphibalanus amphitrite TaxID=1232801 RepID=A0A6A4VB76_AMPAM|nr:hypothetical protein FJT64_013797 [Amphibalanus amphitrite]